MDKKESIMRGENEKKINELLNREKKVSREKKIKEGQSRVFQE